MRVKKISYLFFCCFFSITSLQAQNFLLAHHYNASNGLPQNSVMDICFDKNQNLWLTTEGGVVMLNGKKITTHFPKSNTGIISQRYRSIVRIADTLIIEDEFGTIYKVMPNNDIVPYFPQKNQSLLGGLTTYGFFSDFASYLKLRKAMISIKKKPINIKSYTDKFLRHMVIYDNQVLLYDQQSNLIKMVAFNDSYPITGTWLKDSYYVLDNKNKIWRVNFEKNKLEAVTLKGVVLKPKELIVFSEYMGEEEINLMATENRIFQLAQKNPLEIEARFLLEHQSTTDKRIKKILYHLPTKQILIGTTVNGLYIYKAVYIKTVKYKGFNNDNSFYAITPYDDTTILEFKRRLVSINTEKSYPLDRTMPSAAVYEDKKNVFWFSSDDSLFSFKKGEYKTTIFPIKNTKNIETTAYWDDRNRLWLANRIGIGYYEKDSIRYAAKYPFKEVINLTYRIHKLNANEFLAATQTGLYILNIQTGLVTNYPQLDGIKVREIQVINGTFFICTYGNGIYVLKENRAIKLPDNGNKHLSHIHTAFKDVYNRIWFTTNKGLFYSNYSEIQNYLADSTQFIDYTLFNESDGIGNAEFNGGCYPAVASLKDGMKVLPTIDGLVWFKPHEIPLKNPSAPINIQYLLADGDTVKIVKNNHLSGWSKTITVQFSHAFWGNAENRKLFYKLKGHTSKWQRVNDKEDFIVFKNLPPGQYELLLAIYNNGLFITNENSSISFSIHRKFYQQIWFWLLVVIFLVLIFIFGLQWDKVRSKKKQKRLEALINAKSKELVEKNNLLADKIAALTSSQNELEESLDMKNKFISILSHDVISPLRFINMYARINIEDNANDATKLADALSEIKDSTEKLRHNAQNVLTWIKYNNKRIEVRPEKLSPFVLIENIFEGFDALARHQKVELTNQTSEEDVITSDENILVVVLRNVISNALKATHNGSVMVNGYWEHGHYIFIVQDTGTGMHEAEVKRLQKMSGQKITPRHTDAGNGIGYFIIDELLTHINGIYSIQSIFGKGTRVSIKIPIYETKETI